jgi:hypothetical protein
MLPLRYRIMEQARQYLGTPFQPQGRLKGVALDCVGLPLCVAEDLGLVDRAGVPMLKSDYRNYSPQPLNGFVHDECVRRLFQHNVGELQVGDVLTLRVPRVPCHVAIVSEFCGILHMVHAYEGYATKKLPQGRCVEHVLTDKWRARIEGAFSFPGVE